MVENTTKSKFVFAGIVTWNVVTSGGDPLLVPGSPKYLAAVPMSPATNGARNAATCRLLVAVPSVLTVNVTVTQSGALVLFLNRWVLYINGPPAIVPGKVLPAQVPTTPARLSRRAKVPVVPAGFGSGVPDGVGVGDATGVGVGVGSVPPQLVVVMFNVHPPLKLPTSSSASSTT